jgi:uncharacterized protein (TIGR00730 family)
MIRRICVFCGSSEGNRPVYREAARAVGGLLARRRIGLVYGGGHVGLMGALADSVLESGGEAIGVIPRALMEKELGHRGLTELRVVASMHERKALMVELSDAFMALPGGFGTLEELCEVLTWSQLGLHRKPCGLLDVDDYYSELLGLLDRAVTNGFLHPTHRALLLSDTEPERLLDSLLSATVPQLDKWLDRTQL